MGKVHCDKVTLTRTGLASVDLEILWCNTHDRPSMNCTVERMREALIAVEEYYAMRDQRTHVCYQIAGVGLGDETRIVESRTVAPQLEGRGC